LSGKKRPLKRNKGKVIRLRLAGNEWVAKDSSFLTIVQNGGEFSITVRANLPQQELLVNIDQVKSMVPRGAPQPSIYPITTSDRAKRWKKQIRRYTDGKAR